jgi:CRISPR-associated endonuclease Cas1
MAEPSISPVAGLFADDNTHVIVADGYCVSIRVTSGHLHISDGIGRTRRERRIPRIPRTVERLVILSATGMITTDAIRWLADTGTPWVQLDLDGRTIAMSGPQRTDARLLRSQALAPGNESGLEVTRTLLAAKLAGQSDICRNTLRVPAAANMIDDLAMELDRCPELDDCRTTEGAAAVAYWQAWADRVSVPFPAADMLKIPAHWLRFPGRDSEIGPAHRHATEPVNALLNYVYRIAETECVHACHAVGLNPMALL